MAERCRAYLFDCCGATKTTLHFNPLMTYDKDILPSTVQGGLKRNRKKSEVTKEVIIKRASTKILVPVAKDSNGQLRLSSDILQKAVLMATQGGQIENLPTSGLIIANDADATATERNVDNLTASFTIDSNNTELWQ